MSAHVLLVFDLGTHVEILTLFIGQEGYFFFNDTATTEIYTLSLHDALPISLARIPRRTGRGVARRGGRGARSRRPAHRDRKSTRLNSSHGYISYAVFCLKKKIRLECASLADERLPPALPITKIEEPIPALRS